MRVTPNITKCDVKNRWMNGAASGVRMRGVQSLRRSGKSSGNRMGWGSREGRRIMLTSDVEESCAGEDVTDLFVLMQMPISYRRERTMSIPLPNRVMTKQATSRKLGHSLLKERFQLAFIRVPQPLLSDIDRVSVLVASLLRQFVDLSLPCSLFVDGDSPVQNVELLEQFRRDGFARVVSETLVAGNVVKVVGAHGQWFVWVSGLDWNEVEDRMWGERMS